MDSRKMVQMNLFVRQDRDPDVENGFVDSMGEGEGGII